MKSLSPHIGNSSIQDMLSGKTQPKYTALQLAVMGGNPSLADFPDGISLADFPDEVNDDMVQSYSALFQDNIFTLQRQAAARQAHFSQEGLTIGNNGPVIDVPRPKKSKKYPKGKPETIYKMEILLQDRAMEYFALPNDKNSDDEFLICIRHKKLGFTRIAFGRIETLVQKYQDKFNVIKPYISTVPSSSI